MWKSCLRFGSLGYCLLFSLVLLLILFLVKCARSEKPALPSGEFKVGELYVSYSIDLSAAPEMKRAIANMMDQFAQTAGKAYAKADAFGTTEAIENLRILLLDFGKRTTDDVTRVKLSD